MLAYVIHMLQALTARSHRFRLQPGFDAFRELLFPKLRSLSNDLPAQGDFEIPQKDEVISKRHFQVPLRRQIET